MASRSSCSVKAYIASFMNSACRNPAFERPGVVESASALMVPGNSSRREPFRILYGMALLCVDAGPMLTLKLIACQTQRPRTYSVSCGDPGAFKSSKLQCSPLKNIKSHRAFADRLLLDPTARPATSAGKHPLAVQTLFPVPISGTRECYVPSGRGVFRRGTRLQLGSTGRVCSNASFMPAEFAESRTTELQARRPNLKGKEKGTYKPFLWC